MNRLFLTVGLPRSGKSTWAKAQGIPIVNPDSIRLAIHGKAFDPYHEDLVWYTTRIMVNALFHTGFPNVILDATNLLRANRNKWNSGIYENHFVCFYEYPEICNQRAVASGKDYLLPVIKRMHESNETVHPTEGYIHVGKNFTVASWIASLSS